MLLFKTLVFKVIYSLNQTFSSEFLKENRTHNLRYKILSEIGHEYSLHLMNIIKKLCDLDLKAFNNKLF